MCIGVSACALLCLIAPLAHFCSSEGRFIFFGVGNHKSDETCMQVFNVDCGSGALPFTRAGSLDSPRQATRTRFSKQRILIQHLGPCKHKSLTLSANSLQTNATCRSVSADRVGEGIMTTLKAGSSDPPYHDSEPFSKMNNTTASIHSILQPANQCLLNTLESTNCHH